MNAVNTTSHEAARSVEDKEVLLNTKARRKRRLLVNALRFLFLLMIIGGWEAATRLGIVDPFLNARFVEKGEKFWIYLYPMTITSLKHLWTHPDFETVKVVRKMRRGKVVEVPVTPEPTTPAEISKKWITDFAESYGEDFETFMYHAKDYLEHDEYWVEGGRFEGDYVPEEFWDHYQMVTGTVVEKKGSFFSCSC